MTGDDIAAALDAFTLLDTDEYALQDAIDLALRRAGAAPLREVRLTAADRIDLLIGTVGIEVKVAGSVAAVERQLRRYATCGLISELVLVTTRVAHTAIDDVGCPLHVVPLMRGVT